MLKDEERIAEVKRRIAKKEQQQRLRRRRIISAVCIAACFAVIVGVSFAMPGIVGQIEPGTSSGFETAATILGGSTALGYMVIGLLAFILGVCVTVLCFRIRQLNKELKATGCITIAGRIDRKFFHEKFYSTKTTTERSQDNGSI